jgi:diacylglycerol kinase family enzyme
MFENAEALQKGNWGALGELAAQFVGSTPAALRLEVDDEQGKHQPIETEAHALLALNTPYVGANFRVADDIHYDDGCLDVFLYAGLNQLDLVAHGLAIATDTEPDPRIRRLRARRLTLYAEPPVPILVDGINLGEGPATLQVHPGALHVITGTAAEVAARKQAIIC